MDSRLTGMSVKTCYCCYCCCCLLMPLLLLLQQLASAVLIIMLCSSARNRRQANFSLWSNSMDNIHNKSEYLFIRFYSLHRHLCRLVTCLYSLCTKVCLAKLLVPRSLPFGLTVSIYITRSNIRPCISLWFLTIVLCTFQLPLFALSSEEQSSLSASAGSCITTPLVGRNCSVRPLLRIILASNAHINTIHENVSVIDPRWYSGCSVSEMWRQMLVLVRERCVLSMLSVSKLEHKHDLLLKVTHWRVDNHNYHRSTVMKQ